MGMGNKGTRFLRLLPADLRASHFEGPKKAGVVAKSRNSWLFNFTVQTLWGRLVPPGLGKMLAEKRIKLSLGKTFFLSPFN